MLSDGVSEKLYDDDETIIMVTFDGFTSEDSTINTVGDFTKIKNYSSRIETLINLSNNYNGYVYNNYDSTLFVSMISTKNK